MAISLAFCVLFLAGTFLRSRHKARRGGRGASSFPGVVLLTMLVGPLVHASGVLSSLDTASPVPLRITGLMIAALSLLLLNAAYRDLGTNWDQVPSVPSRLVTSGCYQHVRHPIYSAALLWCLGQSLGIPNVLAGAILPLLLVTFLLARVLEEELLLLRAYGQVYRRYMRRVPRFVPRLWAGSG